MILPFLIVFSFSSIYSLDLGSQNIRIATSVTGKPVEIKLNARDHRSTENYLAFPLTEKLEKFEKVNWLIGSDAERISMGNSSYGIANPFGLIWAPEDRRFNGLHPSLLFENADVLCADVCMPKHFFILFQSGTVISFMSNFSINSFNFVSLKKSKLTSS